MKKLAWWWPKRDELLRNGHREDIVTNDRYRSQKAVVKQTVKVAKRMAYC